MTKLKESNCANSYRNKSCRSLISFLKQLITLQGYKVTAKHFMKKSFKVISQTGDNAILFICMAAFVAVLTAGYIKLFVEFLKSIL